MESNASKNTLQINLIMTKENNCTVNLRIYDTTNYPNGNNTEFDSFLHGITHEYNVLYELEPDKWVEARSYQKNAAIHYIKTCKNETVKYSNINNPDIIPKGYIFELSKKNK